MTLQEIVDRYRDTFLVRYGQHLDGDQWSALNAIAGCRQGQYGDMMWSCNACPHDQRVPRSCGHRACNQCQQHSTQQWLDRQLNKQLPVNYYMATFTLPYELRALAQAHRKTVYRLLIESATYTLKTFGLNQPNFNAELGLCAVLHTHTRRMDYHPHVHVVVPGGGLHRGRKEWRKVRGRYLFNGRALAAVFRARFLKTLRAAGLIAAKTPDQWIVHCDKVGRGKEALQYLSRYLYRGVLSNKNLLLDDGHQITFRYKDSKTNIWCERTLPGEEFIYLILQHVLPKGFRRARDYGFLHGNAKAILNVVQWILKVQKPAKVEMSNAKKSCMICPHCKGSMHVVGVLPVRSDPG
jgi:hypothetical protein